MRVREAEEWIAEASAENIPYHSGIAKLREHLAKNLVPEARSVLENGLVNIWNRQADEWMREANNAQQASKGIDTLKSALAQALRAKLKKE